MLVEVSNFKLAAALAQWRMKKLDARRGVEALVQLFESSFQTYVSFT